MGFLSLFVCLFIASYIPLLELKKLAVWDCQVQTKKKKKIYPQQKPVIYIQRKKIEAA